MATLTSAQGFVDDGTGNLTVQGTSVSNAEAKVVNLLTGSNFCVIPSSGFFQVPVSGSGAAGAFTGSLPSPLLNAGGSLMITDSTGVFPYLISGTISILTGSTALTQARSISGTKLTVTAGGSVGLWSDGKGWMVCAASGTMTLA